ncbi:MAG TPA: hypothetical protein V6D20_01835, partial [Candidatus Obscuribacterales bacterium]
MSEPTVGLGPVPRKRSRQPAIQLSDEALAQEILYRKMFPKGLKFQAHGMTPDDVNAVLAAFTTFCEHAVQIKYQGTHGPLELREAQRETLRDIVENRRVIILKARQIGFSTLISVFALWCAMAGHDRQIYFLSRGQREARSLLSKARYAYRKMPD